MECCLCKEPATWQGKPLIGKTKYFCFNCVVANSNGSHLFQPIEDIKLHSQKHRDTLIQ